MEFPRELAELFGGVVGKLALVSRIRAGVALHFPEPLEFVRQAVEIVARAEFLQALGGFRVFASPFCQIFGELFENAVCEFGVALRLVRIFASLVRLLVGLVGFFRFVLALSIRVVVRLVFLGIVVVLVFLGLLRHFFHGARQLVEVHRIEKIGEVEQCRRRVG